MCVYVVCGTACRMRERVLTFMAGPSLSFSHFSARTHTSTQGAYKLSHPGGGGVDVRTTSASTVWWFRFRGSLFINLGTRVHWVFMRLDVVWLMLTYTCMFECVFSVSAPGAFLVPYFVMVLVIGLPIFFAELFVGQYSGLGPILAYGRLAPFFQGKR